MTVVVCAENRLVLGPCLRVSRSTLLRIVRATLDLFVSVTTLDVMQPSFTYIPRKVYFPAIIDAVTGYSTAVSDPTH